MSFNRGDFSFILDANERAMLMDAYNAVKVTESWDKISQDPGAGGFMFSNNEWMNPINAAIKYDGHSGSSYAFTMRSMQYIGANGWDKWVALRLNKV